MLIDIAKADILYHTTILQYAYYILKDMQLLASTSVGDEAETTNAQYPFFVSFARNKSNNFSAWVRKGINKGVIFEFDGRRLGTKYKFTQIDFWRGRAKNLAEDEERLLSKTGTIPLKYSDIRRVYVWINPEKAPADSFLFKFIVLCLRNHIPVTPYLTGSLKPIPVSSFLNYIKQNRFSEPSDRVVQRDSLWLNALKNLVIEDKPITHTTDAFMQHIIDRLEAKNINNLASELGNYLLAYKSASSTRKLISAARKLDLLTPKDIVRHLVNKYKDAK